MSRWENQVKSVTEDEIKNVRMHVEHAITTDEFLFTDNGNKGAIAKILGCKPDNIKTYNRSYSIDEGSIAVNAIGGTREQQDAAQNEYSELNRRMRVLNQALSGSGSPFLGPDALDGLRALDGKSVEEKKSCLKDIWEQIDRSLIPTPKYS